MADMKLLRFLLRRVLDRQSYCRQNLLGLNDHLKSLGYTGETFALESFMMQDIYVGTIVSDIGLTHDILNNLDDCSDWTGDVRAAGDALRKVLDDESLSLIRNIYQHLGDYVAGKGHYKMLDTSQFSMGLAFSSLGNVEIHAFGETWDVTEVFLAGEPLAQAIDARVVGEVDLAKALADGEIDQTEHNRRLGSLP